MTTANTFWEYIEFFAARLAVIVGIVLGLYALAQKWDPIARRISAHRIRKRMDSCPMRIDCMAHDEAQNKQIKLMQDTYLMIQGGLIAIHCKMAIKDDYLPLYDREWIENSWDDYSNKGGNHGVERLVTLALALPENPPKNRRCTDKE